MKLVQYFAITLSLSVLTGCMQKQIMKAETAYESQEYTEGANQFKSVYPKLGSKGAKAKAVKGDMAFKTAESYRLSLSYKDANEWYERAINLDYATKNPEVYYYNGLMLQALGQLDKAVKSFEEYKKLVSTDERADIALQSCKSTEEVKADKSRHVIENQATLNSKEYDMSAVFGDAKETKLYFSSSRTGVTGDKKDLRSGESTMDIWFAVVDAKGNWAEPKIVNGINTEDNEGAICFDGKKKVMFFTRCPNEKKKNLGCEIWMSETKGKDEWGEPTILPLKIEDSISVGHPCVSEDGKFLIFVSDMPGGFGGKDLWYTTYDKKNNKWAEPVNLGGQINTKGDEMFPTFAKNGDLYFASNGYLGLGGLDLLKAKKVGQDFKWENPTNLGYPINSEFDDYALTEVTTKKGYFTSDRKGPNGTRPDIYSYSLPDNLYDLKVIVSEITDKSKRIAGAKVAVTGSDGSAWEGLTSKDGAIYFDKDPKGTRYLKDGVEYTIKIAKDGYYENKNGVKISTKNLTENQNFVTELSLLPIQKDPEIIRLPEVRYPYNQATLLVDNTINSKDSLNFVFDLLTKYPGMVLELVSHTDARGEDIFNLDLSQRRAKECVRYLVEEKGIDPKRLVPVGKGETQPATYIDPITKEKIVLTEEYINKFKSDKVKFEMLHQLNRRTEAKILSLEYTQEEKTEE